MAGAYPSFLSMKHAQECCFSPLDGILVNPRVLPLPSHCSMSLVPIYNFGYFLELADWAKMGLSWAKNTFMPTNINSVSLAMHSQTLQGIYPTPPPPPRTR